LTLNGAKKMLGHIEQCQGDMKDIIQGTPIFFSLGDGG